MGNYFSADLHLGHEKIITHCGRPFKSVEEMDGHLYYVFGQIPRGSHLFVLGDIAWRKEQAEAFLSLMKDSGIMVHLIVGNHDHKPIRKLAERYCASVSDIKWLTVEGQGIMMCHYPMRSWRNNCHGSWNLHGHCHGTIVGYKNQLDVGVDTHGFKPYTFEEVMASIRVNNEKAEESFCEVDHMGENSD